MHLTNYAVNKRSENFVRDENSGSKRWEFVAWVWSSWVLIHLYSIHIHQSLTFHQYDIFCINMMYGSLYIDTCSICLWMLKWLSMHLFSLSTNQEAVSADPPLTGEIMWRHKAVAGHRRSGHQDPGVRPLSPEPQLPHLLPPSHPARWWARWPGDLCFIPADPYSSCFTITMEIKHRKWPGLYHYCCHRFPAQNTPQNSTCHYILVIIL